MSGRVRSPESMVQLFGLITPLFRKFDDIGFLVTLINLNAQHRRRGSRLLSFLLFDGMGMRRGRGSRRRSATLKKSPGIGGRNFILLSVEGVAQGELNAAF